MTGHEAYRRSGPPPWPPAFWEYDTADDGPECEVITRILAGHPSYIPGIEKQAIEYSRYLDVAALVLYNKPFAELSAERQGIIRQRISHTWRLF